MADSTGWTGDYGPCGCYANCQETGAWRPPAFMYLCDRCYGIWLRARHNH